MHSGSPGPVSFVDSEIFSKPLARLHERHSNRPRRSTFKLVQHWYHSGKLGGSWERRRGSKRAVNHWYKINPLPTIHPGFRHPTHLTGSTSTSYHCLYFTHWHSKPGLAINIPYPRSSHFSLISSECPISISKRNPLNCYRQMGLR